MYHVYMYSMTPLEVFSFLLIFSRTNLHTFFKTQPCLHVCARNNQTKIHNSFGDSLRTFQFFPETRIIWHWRKVIYVEISQTTNRANSLSVIGKEYFLSRSKINLKQAYLQLNLFDENLSKHETLRNIDVNHTSKLK